jgi:hypothetical protein
VKWADGNLQHRVTQKHVTNIEGFVNFRHICCFGREVELDYVTLELPNVLYGCKMWNPSLEEECTAVSEKKITI